MVFTSPFLLAAVNHAQSDFPVCDGVGLRDLAALPSAAVLHRQQPIRFRSTDDGFPPR